MTTMKSRPSIPETKRDLKKKNAENKYCKKRIEKRKKKGKKTKN